MLLTLLFSESVSVRVLSVDENDLLGIIIHTNSTNKRVYVKGIYEAVKADLFTVAGKQLLSKMIETDYLIYGLYLLKVIMDKGSVTKKMVVK